MFAEGGMRIYRQASPLYSRKGACQGTAPETPDKKKGKIYVCITVFYYWFNTWRQRRNNADVHISGKPYERKGRS